MEKHIKTIVKVELSSFKEVKEYINGLNEVNIFNIYIDPPILSSKKWRVTSTWKKKVKC